MTTLMLQLARFASRLLTAAILPMIRLRNRLDGWRADQIARRVALLPREFS